MPPPPPDPNDFSHLPNADERAAAERRAKEDLWRKVKQQRQSRLSAGTPAQQPPQEHPESAQASAPSRSGWEELMHINPEDGQVAGDMMTYSQGAPSMPAAQPPAAPAGRKKTVIRQRGSVPPPVEEPVYQEPPPAYSPEETQPEWQDPAAQHYGQEPAYDPSWTQEPTGEGEPSQAEPPVEPPASSEPAGRANEAVTSEGKAAPSTAKKESAKAPACNAGESKAASESKPSAAPDEGDSAKKEGEDAESSKKDATEAKPGAEDLRTKAKELWVRWGGKSLSMSLAVHAAILAIAGFIVVQQAMEPEIDFMPGGTTVQGRAAAADLQHKIQQKQNPWLKKTIMRKVAVKGASEVILPDEMPDLLELPNSGLLNNGKFGGGMGLGGAGGGFNKGLGLGSRTGSVFQPLSMFGREIKARRLALVLDVSGSMTPHLERVIAELDKVARGSVVVLYYGCGIKTPPRSGVDGDEVFRTSGIEFEKYWRLDGGSLEQARKYRINKADAIPMEQVYTLLAKRPQTYFIHNVGVDYAWIALLCDQVRQADALYWFSDFEDSADFQQIMILQENLLARKQRLYIQPYKRGSSFDLIRSQLVEKTGGEVIEAAF